MKKFLTILFLITVFVSSAFTWHLTAATHLQHDWRQYFTLDNNSLAGAEVIKMHISPTGYTYVLVKRTFWDFPYYILEFDNLGNLINKVSANYPGPCWIYSYCDMALDKKGRIYLLGSFTNEAYITRSFLQTYGDDFKLLSCFVFAEGEASGLCLGEMGEVYVVGVNPSQSHFVAMLGKRGFAVAKSVTPANSNQMNFVEPIWLTLLPDNTWWANGKIILDEMGNLCWGSPLWEYKCRGVENGSYIAKIDDQGCLLWHAFLPPKRPRVFLDDFVNATTIALYQGSIYAAGICGSTLGFGGGDSYGFLDKITEKK